jgi:hypothetical protein
MFLSNETAFNAVPPMPAKKGSPFYPQSRAARPIPTIE